MHSVQRRMFVRDADSFRVNLEKCTSLHDYLFTASQSLVDLLLGVSSSLQEVRRLFLDHFVFGSFRNRCSRPSEVYFP